MSPNVGPASTPPPEVEPAPLEPDVLLLAELDAPLEPLPLEVVVAPLEPVELAVELAEPAVVPAVDPLEEVAPEALADVEPPEVLPPDDPVLAELQAASASAPRAMKRVSVTGPPLMEIPVSADPHRATTCSKPFLHLRGNVTGSSRRGVAALEPAPSWRSATRAVWPPARATSGVFLPADVRIAQHRGMRSLIVRAVVGSGLLAAAVGLAGCGGSKSSSSSGSTGSSALRSGAFSPTSGLAEIGVKSDGTFDATSSIRIYEADYALTCPQGNESAPDTTSHHLEIEIDPGSGRDIAPGTRQITGASTQQSNGELVTVILANGPSDHSGLAVSGTVTIDSVGLSGVTGSYNITFDPRDGSSSFATGGQISATGCPCGANTSNSCG